VLCHKLLSLRSSCETRGNPRSLRVSWFALPLTTRVFVRSHYADSWLLPWPGGTAGWLNSEKLARATGSSSMISLRKQETWGEGGSDPVARNEWMCILDANQGAQAQVSKAELTPRCSGTYGQNRRLITAGLRILSFQQGQKSAKVVQTFFIAAFHSLEFVLFR
jgi:hypothetical protein